MATVNTCKKCGCQDSFIPSPAPCPTPAGCPTPQPCSEIFDAKCVRYTGLPLSCTVVAQTFSAEPGPAPAPAEPIVNTNDTVAEALQGIVDYICNNSGGGSMTSTITCGIQDYPSTVIVNSGTSYNDAIVAVSNYYCDQINNILNNPSCPPQVSIVRNNNSNTLTATASGGSGNFSFQWEFASFVNGITPMFTISTQGNTSTTSTITFSNFNTSYISPFPGGGFGMYIGLAKVTATDESTGCVAKDTYLVIDIIPYG